jgi:hypothetical protein
MRKFILWAIWALLFAVWAQTVYVTGVLQHDNLCLLLAGVSVVLLVILYFAEGLELAVADLRDKDPQQIHDPRLKKILVDLQGKDDFFFAHRQPFVVVIINVVSLSLAYEALYTWPLGEIKDPAFKFLFNLLFVTLTVLWFCQVTPKRLAIINSELFLAQAKFLWPIIKLLSVFHLPGPADEIVAVSRRILGYNGLRNLLPSRPAHFNHAAQLYGQAVDTLAIDIEIHADGSATIRKRFVALFMHGHISQIDGLISTAFYEPSRIHHLEVKPVYLGLTLNRENLAEIAPQLDAVAETEPAFEAPCERSGFSKNLVTELVTEVGPYLDENISGSEARWSIRLKTSLPEGYYTRDAEIGTGTSNIIAVFAYDLIAECAPGFFGTFRPEDYWEEHVTYPCRNLKLNVHAAADSGFDVAMRKCHVGLYSLHSPLETEQERCLNAFAAGSEQGGGCLKFPLQDAVYRVELELIRDHRHEPVLAIAPPLPAQHGCDEPTTAASPGNT